MEYASNIKLANDNKRINQEWCTIELRKSETSREDMDPKIGEW